MLRYVAGIWLCLVAVSMYMYSVVPEVQKLATKVEGLKKKTTLGKPGFVFVDLREYACCDVDALFPLSLHFMCRCDRWLPPLCSEHVALELDEEKGKINPVAKTKVDSLVRAKLQVVLCLFICVSGRREEVWAGYF